MTDLDRGRDYEPSVYATHEDEYDDYDVDEEEEGGSRAAVILLVVICLVIALGVAYVSYRLGYNNGVRDASVPRLAASAEGGKVRPSDPGGMIEPEPSALDKSVTSGGDDDVGSLLPREEPVIDLTAAAAEGGNSVPGVDVPITLGEVPESGNSGKSPAGGKTAADDPEEATPVQRSVDEPKPAPARAGDSDRIFVPRPGGASPARAAPAKPKVATPPAPKVTAPSPTRPRAPAGTASVPNPSARVVPAPSGEAPSPSSEGRYVVQLASLPSQTMADDAWTRISGKYPDLLGNAARDIEEADLGAKGIYYRLRVGYFQDRSSATALCETLKTRGQDCLVTTR